MNNAAPLAHAAVSGFPVIDDCLHVGGIPLTALAEQVGQTPFYAYDRALITERVQKVRRLFPADIHWHYAVKANPMPDVLQHMATVVDGCDVASAGELQRALNAGFTPENISFAGPGKRPEELRHAIAVGALIHVESERELATIAQLAGAFTVQPRVALRVNPDFTLKAAGMQMGGGPKPFGIDAEIIPDVLHRLKSLPVRFEGFHIFSGSQNLRAESLIAAQQQSLALAFQLATDAQWPLQQVNIGGGFGIPYFPGEQPLDVAAIGAALHAQWPTIQQQWPQLRVVIELGRYFVGEAGIYVAKIIDRKVSRGQCFLITDGGMHHHLAASGNFGQVIRKNYPVIVGNRVQGTAREQTTVVGPLCTPLDILADRMDLARADVGDLIVVFQSGAYGLSASPIHFLGHPPCAEILV